MKLAVLRNRNFALYSAGNIVSWLGLWMQRIGIGWLSWDLTHSPFWVGVVSMSQFMPIMFFGPFFGVLADKVDRKRYAIIVQATLMLLSGLLYLITALDGMRLWILVALCACLGTASAAHQPVRLALVNDLVPRNLLSQAITINSILFNMSRFIGPALGGISIAAFGVASTFGINALSYLAIIFSLNRIEMAPSGRGRAHTGFLAELGAGLRYSFSHPVIAQLMLLSGITAFFGRGTLELLPAFADAVYARGPAGLATLSTAAGAGAVLGGTMLTHFGTPHLQPRLARSGSVAAGLVLFVLGLAHPFWAGIAVVAALACATTLCNIGLQVELQSVVDDDYRGRVVSLWGIVTIAAPSLGGTLIGGLAKWGGLMPVTLGCGLGCAALTAWVIRRNRPAAAHPPPA